MSDDLIDAVEVDLAMKAFQQLYDGLVRRGLRPASVSIGMSECVAYIVAFKNVTGAGDAAIEAWMTGFVRAYREQVATLTAERSRAPKQ